MRVRDGVGELASALLEDAPLFPLVPLPVRL